MIRHPISDERIFEMIEAFGADVRAFPEVEQEAARRRMTEAPGVFASALEAARSLDSMLAGLPEPSISSALREGILAAAPRDRTQAAGRWGLLSRLPNWLPAGAFASLAMGLVIGVNVSLPAAVATASVEDADSVMYAAFGFDDYPLIDEAIE
ncbi:MAG: hypothetical protein R3C13_08215 [Hyphomonas sp.]|uniref:hypothetical protein n=1 Tax=Hyphomonas sp. TaxID=87 RepID=UPI0035297DC6